MIELGNGGGGGAAVALAPSTFGPEGRLPSNFWTVDVVNFYFSLFLHVTLGLSKKIVGEIWGVFSFV